MHLREHMIKKTITIREDQRRYVHGRIGNLSKYTREQIRKFRDGELQWRPPKGDTRRHDLDRMRTQITISEELDEFIQNEQVNISQFIQDSIQHQLDQSKELQMAEAGQKPTLPDRLELIGNFIVEQDITAEDGF